MVLVDTSIWIDHFKSTNEELKILLNEGLVTIHPFVIGELACGNLHNREVTLGLLDSLPKPILATNHEAYHLIESRKLSGLGIGFLDVHLIGSCQLSDCTIWTRDKLLLGIAQNLGLAFNSNPN